MACCSVRSELVSGVSENELFKTSDSCCHDARLQTASHHCSDHPHPAKPARRESRPHSAKIQDVKKNPERGKNQSPAVSRKQMLSQNRHWSWHQIWGGTVNSKNSKQQISDDPTTQNRWAPVVSFIHSKSQMTLFKNVQSFVQVAFLKKS